MLKSQLATMTEKRALEKDPIEDGMALYRQQALIVSRKKDACAEKRGSHLQTTCAAWRTKGARCEV